jgi:ATP-dependent Clp protease protease subunit
MADAIISLPNPKNRNLYLAQQVDQASINTISKEIIEINEDDANIAKVYAMNDLVYNPKPIKLYIDSYGGYVYQCFGLLGIMQKSKVPVHTIVTGCAMSCGFLIAISGHKRFGYEKATYMYHQVSSATRGKVKDMEEDIIETVRLQKMIEEHTLEHTKISAKKLAQVYKGKRDWFIDSTEALKLKVIDELI